MYRFIVVELQLLNDDSGDKIKWKGNKQLINPVTIIKSNSSSK